MDGSIGGGIASLIFYIALIALVGGGIIVGGIWFFTDKDYIESKTLITPEIELTTDGKTIDTLYIYRQP